MGITIHTFKVTEPAYKYGTIKRNNKDFIGLLGLLQTKKITKMGFNTHSE